MSTVDTAATAFVLVSAALVMVMTPGLAFFYGGLVRRKNVLMIMMQSFVSMGIVTVIWVFGGFSLVFAPSQAGIIGDLRYIVLEGIGGDPILGQVIPSGVLFVYQEMFAIITPALITGAFADRVTFKAYLIFLVVWSIIVYIPLAHWLWGGGWEAKLGAVDFAGGSVVHASAGFAALASVLYIGKRKIDPAEKVTPHNITYVALGTGLLWFGWFGFNGGSALAANAQAANAYVTTDIAGSVAFCVWLAISWIFEGRPSVSGALTGAVAGLATITPAAGYVHAWAAIVIGFLAAVICYCAMRLRATFGFDDALDVWACHGVGGVLGMICTGIFAQKNVGGISGLVEGDWRQLGVEVMAGVVAAAFSFVATWIMLWIINFCTPVRVGETEEFKGLDETSFGEVAYQL